MRSKQSGSTKSVAELVRLNYCIWGPDGREDPIRIRAVVDALGDFDDSGPEDLPDIKGVPRLQFRIDRLAQIREAVEQFLPTVTADPRLHALSIVDPLRCANELGVAVHPAVARTVRRVLTGIVAFDLAALNSEGLLRGNVTIRWTPKRSKK